MTAQEFIRLDYNVLELEKVKGKYSNPKAVAKQVESKMKINLREQVKYEESKDLFIELTMSCDKEEAKRWMTTWMLSAILYGINSGDLDWRYFFLASYDILESIK